MLDADSVCLCTRYSLLTPVAIHKLVNWLWELVQDGPAADQLSDEILDATLSRLEAVLVAPSLVLQDLKSSFLHRCCNCIAEHRSVPQAIRIMLSLLQSYVASRRWRSARCASVLTIALLL